MTSEQKKLAITVGFQLINLEQNIAHEIDNLLKNLAIPATEKGLQRNGISITAEDIQATVGPDVWLDIKNSVDKLKKFIGE